MLKAQPDTDQAIKDDKRSRGSLGIYESAMKLFDVYCKKQGGSIPEAVTLYIKTAKDDPDAIHYFLKDFARFLNKKSLNPRTKRVYFGEIRRYLRSKGIKTDDYEIKRIMKNLLAEILHEEPIGVDKETLRILLDNSSELKKCLYLVLLSSGLRIKECLSLRMKNIDFEPDLTRIHVQAEFTKTKRSHTTYCSSEARAILDRITNGKKPEDRIFTELKELYIAVIMEENYFRRLRQRCNLIKRYDTNSRNLVTMHSFRKYFFTIATHVHDLGYAHAMISHGDSLTNVYTAYTSAKKDQLYKDLEPYLLIYGSEEYAKTQSKMAKQISDQKQQLEEQSKKISEISSVADLLPKYFQSVVYNPGFNDSEKDKKIMRSMPFVRNTDEIPLEKSAHFLELLTKMLYGADSKEELRKLIDESMIEYERIKKK